MQSLLVRACVCVCVCGALYSAQFTKRQKNTQVLNPEEEFPVAKIQIFASDTV